MSGQTDHGGSVEVGGNGLCYSCGKNLAIQGSWLCATCKGEEPTKKTHQQLSIGEIQRRLLEMGDAARKAEVDELPETLFGYPINDPRVKDLL